MFEQGYSSLSRIWYEVYKACLFVVGGDTFCWCYIRLGGLYE